MPEYDWVDFDYKGRHGMPGTLSLTIRAGGEGVLPKACRVALGNPSTVSFLFAPDHTAFAIVAPPRPGASVYKLNDTGVVSMRGLIRLLGIRLPVTLPAKLEDGMLVFEVPRAALKEATDA